MAIYLVTGGGGFIGSNIVEELLNRSERVRVLDNFSTGRRANIGPFLNDIELIEGDVRSYHIVNQAVAGVDFALHQAALPSVPRSIEDPISTNEVNLVGTLNVLDTAKEAGVRRVVYASSSSIYDDTEALPTSESMAPDLLSPYAVSKLAGGKYCQVFSRIHRLETVCLRDFNVFGPGQDPKSQYSAVIPRFINSMLAGKPPTIYGGGLQSRDFAFVTDVVGANLSACEAPDADGEVINIACGNSFSILDLVSKLNSMLKTEIAPVHSEPRSGEVKHSLADIQRAMTLLNYFPKVNFKDGLQRTLEFYKRSRGFISGTHSKSRNRKR